MHTTSPRRSFRVLRHLAALVALAAAGLASTTASAQPTDAQRRAFSLRNVGLARVESQQLAEARDAFEKLVDLFPREALGHADLALCDLRSGDAEAALKRVAKARELAPDRADIALLEVDILRALERYKEALDAVDAALARHPTDARLLFARAQSLEEERDKSREAELLAAWRSLTAAAPGNIYPLMEQLVLGAKQQDWNATREAGELLLATLHQPPDRVIEALDEVMEAASGDAKLAKRAHTRALIVRNVLRPTTRFKRDSELLRLPLTLGGGREVVEFSSPELLAAKEVLASNNAIDLLASAPFSLLVEGLDAARPALVGDIDGDNLSEAVAWTKAPRPAPIVLDRAAGDWSFEATPRIALPIESDHEVLWSALVDLDNDKDLDLVTLAREQGSGAASLWLHAGDRTGRLTVGLSAIHEFGGEVARAAVVGDFDHEGDLDVLFFAREGAGWRARLLVNNLDGTYAEASLKAELLGAEPIALAAADLDDDVSLDVAIRTESSVIVWRNDLDGGFAPLATMESAHAGLGGQVSVGDFDNDGWLEVAASGFPMAFLDNGRSGLRPNPDLLLRHGASRFATGDYDNDGALDLAVAYAEGVFLAPWRGGKPEFDSRNDAKGELSPVAADFDGDGDLDILAFDAANAAAKFHRNDGGNANRWIEARLRGKLLNDQKNNYFGLGSTVEAKAGALIQRASAQTDSTRFGLGQSSMIDALRIVWTNGSPQAVFAPQSNQTIEVEQVILGSCPSLYGWDGERFQFATDVLWRSALGMYIMKDVYGHDQTANDYFLLPPSLCVPKNGKLEFRYVMDLWETAYLDEVHLLAVDHPADGAVFVHEACLAPPYPPFHVYRVAKSERVGLASATDSAGANHLEALSSRDKRYVSNFEPTPYQGIATDHDIVLVPECWPAAGETFRLFLNGWLYPTDASVNVAVAQNSDFTPEMPVVEIQDAGGAWIEAARPGFPAGKFKTMVVDLTAALPAEPRAVRVRANFMIHWDEAFFSIGESDDAARATEMPLASADLRFRGYHRMDWENGVGPFVPDYDDVSPEPRWKTQNGWFTRFGDVREMLLARDDRYVVTGSGEEIALTFDVAALPALPDGWRRDYVIFTDGWLKDGNLNSLTGRDVEPLPYSGMDGFPPSKPNGDPAFRSFVSETLTRYRSRDEFRAALWGEEKESAE